MPFLRTIPSRTVSRGLAWLALTLTLAFGLGVAPQGAAAQSYAAIAYSPPTGQWGWARNYRSRAGAENAAMAQCRGAAGRGCRVVIWFRNACGALATGPRGYGSGWASRQAQANANALASCRQHSRNCQVRVRVCTG